MATVELTNGDIRSHETIEIRGPLVLAYEGAEGRGYGDIERVYTVGSIVEIDPGESEVKGAPPAGDGILFTPD
jgi:hypothetical protein